VQFYEEDVFLIRSLSEFVSTGLSSNEAVIIVATEPHRDSMERRLTANGVDLTAARTRGQYVAIDAAETLSEFMVDGWPNEKLFAKVISDVLVRPSDQYPRRRVFGEMVGLLWHAGNLGGALHLERLWNDLASIQTFALYCAYSTKGHLGEEHQAALLKICAQHSHVIPAEAVASD
jgi:hypothetical protein